MKERIEKRIKELIKEAEQNKINMVACQGAVQVLKELLKEEETDVPDDPEKSSE